VQDPCEMGISGVNVALYEMDGSMTTLIASTITSADGTYYFTDYEQYGSGYDTLTIGHQYFVVVGEGGQFNTSDNSLSIGSDIYELTSQNTGEGTNADLNDSDTFLVNDNTKPFDNFPVDTVTIERGGYVNHSLDFGFIPFEDCGGVICLPITATIIRGSKN